MYFKGNFVSFKNTVKIAAFDPKFSVDSYNLFQIFPIDETFTFYVKHM